MRYLPPSILAVDAYNNPVRHRISRVEDHTKVTLIRASCDYAYVQQRCVYGASNADVLHFVMVSLSRVP